MESFHIKPEFVIPGTKTSANPIAVFAQGLREETSEKVFPLSKIIGIRCVECGYLELFADPAENHRME